jgi:hypothetical protein
MEVGGAPVLGSDDGGFGLFNKVGGFPSLLNADFQSCR